MNVTRVARCNKYRRVTESDAGLGVRVPQGRLDESLTDEWKGLKRVTVITVTISEKNRKEVFGIHSLWRGERR